MHHRLKLWKIPVLILLLLLITAAFSFIDILYDTAAAPYDNRADEVVEYSGNPSESEEPYEPNDEPEEPNDEHEPEDEPDDEPQDEPEVFIDPGFVTVFMEEADIARGFLVLVNHDHAFELPAMLDLVNITTEKTEPFRVLGQNYLLRRSIIEPLDEMMGAYISATGNNTVAIVSAFRNYESQQRALDSNIRRLGEREALRWTSLPGHSEHHTGLAVDFGVFAGGSRSTFTGTGVTSWFRRNSYNYGFILRYPPNRTRITGTVHEPWHFRYVGLPHSYIISQNNWVLEEYLDMLREHRFEDPFFAEHNGIEYRIYFTSDLSIQIPYDVIFDISGNNVDGFIVTVHSPNEHEALLIDAIEDGEAE